MRGERVREIRAYEFNAHVKERKRRPVAIGRAALLEELDGRGDAVDDDDGLAEDVEVDEVRIWGVCVRLYRERCGLGLIQRVVDFDKSRRKDEMRSRCWLKTKGG